MSHYNKVHLWIGASFVPEAEYNAYFELDHSTDIDAPDYKVGGFCRDIGKRWYDEDFIGIIPRSDKLLSLDELLEEAAVYEEEKPKIKAICHELGITKANALLWYQDEELVINKPYKENYNGLQYIGLFEGD